MRCQLTTTGAGSPFGCYLQGYVGIDSTKHGEMEWKCSVEKNKHGMPPKKVELFIKVSNKSSCTPIHLQYLTIDV